MKPVQAAEQLLRDWLEKPQSQEISAHLVRRHLDSPATPEGLGMILAKRFSEDKEELVQELTQEFLLFLHSDIIPKLSRYPDLCNQLLAGNTIRVIQFALNRFIWRLEDRCRTRKDNPRAYIHRRLRDTVRRHPEFHVDKDGRNFLHITLARDLADQPEGTPLPPDMDYHDWLPPPASATQDDFFKESHLKKVLIHFLDQAGERLGGPVTIPLNEVSRYLAVHAAWLNLPASDPDQEPDDLAAAGKTPEEEADYLASLESVRILAAQYFLNMEPDDRRIWCWRMRERAVTHTEIARRLGLPDHNHSHRKFAKIIRELKQFVHNWPGPPVDELDREVNLAFLEELKKLCENPEP